MIYAARSLVALAALAAPVVAGVPQEAWGQDPVRLSTGCADCQIRIDTLAVLGDREGPGMVSEESNLLAVDGQGRYYVMSRPATSVQVFSPEGEFITRIGREGDGPGEFRWAQALYVQPDGRLLVVDRSLQRISLFRADWSLERTVPLPELSPGFEVLPLRGDSILLSGYGFTPELFGIPAHVLGPDGRRVRSFGEPSYVIASRDPFGLMRPVAFTADRDLWVASRDRYLFERWGLDGERKRVFVKDVDWFEPLQRVPGGPPPPRAVLSSIREDADGLLWIKFILPTERWREAVGTSPTDPHGWRMVDQDLWTNVRLEVVDPAEGLVLASIHLPHQAYSNLFGEGLIARTVLDVEAATLQLLVLRLTLEMGEGG